MSLNNKRLALIIGNNNYKDNPLRNSVNDAKSIASTLEKLQFDVRYYSDLTYSAMKTAIDSFGEEVNTNDFETLLFYYAGHGIQVNSINYLIPIDAVIHNERTVEHVCIKADLITSILDTGKEKTNIIILDACRNNPFKRNWTRGISYPEGLAAMNASSGTIIAYSTSPDRIASDGEGENGLYTGVLLQYIRTPNIKIEDLFKKVRKDVEAYSDKAQIPWESTSLKGDFYFNFTKEKIYHRNIYEYLDNLVKEYYKKYDNSKAEALAYLHTATEFDIPLIEVLRTDMHFETNHTEEEIDILAIEHLKNIGYEEKFHRWFYDNRQVNMGELHLIPDELLPRSPHPNKEIHVDFKLSHFFDNNYLRIKGEVDLPDNMQLMLDLKNTNTGYHAQDKIIIKDKLFISSGFLNKGKKVDMGKYNLEISSPIASIQPSEVRKIIGKKGENLIGTNLIEFDLISGNRIVFNQEIDIKYNPTSSP